MFATVICTVTSHQDGCGFDAGLRVLCVQSTHLCICVGFLGYIHVYIDVIGNFKLSVGVRLCFFFLVLYPETALQQTTRGPGESSFERWLDGFSN